MIGAITRRNRSMYLPTYYYNGLINETSFLYNKLNCFKFKLEYVNLVNVIN